MGGGAGFFGSYEETVSDPKVASVYFLTPHHFHLENALLAARYSKHILMEKPIACTIEESTKMIRASRDAGVRLMVAENYRFLPDVERCKEIIGEGAIGDLRLVQIQAEGFGEPTGWRLDPEMAGGGRFIDGGIHYVDILLNIGGFPEGVYAARPPQVFRDLEGEDGLVMTARLPGGAVGLINFSVATAVDGQRRWVNVTGTKGQLSFDVEGREVTVETASSRRTVEVAEARRGVPQMVEEFRASVLADREPVMSGEEGVKDLAIVLGAYESVQHGGEVALKTVYQGA